IHLEFENQSFQSRVQGLWHTSRGPIQQLQFANSHHEPTEWLAVRHGGATSILRIVLREHEVPTLYRIPHVPLLGAEVEIRIELEHVTVLPVQSLGDALHTDICFNPWQASEIAVLDQSSRWKVWKIRSVNKHTKVWTSEARCSGHLMEEAPDDANYAAEKIGIKRYDGWGAVRFVGNGDYLLVCNREQTAYFNLRSQPASSQRPELGLKKSADWILNVSHVSTLSDYIFMITSSRILWIHLALDFERTEQPQLNARSLLAWRHFSSMEDLSLSTQIVVRNNAVGHLAGNERDSPYQENEIHLLRCMVLNSDLTLIESYIVSCFPKLLPRTLQAPRSLRRPRPPRSSYRVPDHFIIPNGLLDEDAQERTTQPASSSTRGSTNPSDVKHRNLPQPKDQWTINLEWLGKHISSPVAYSLEERLQFVRSRLDVDNNLPGQRLVSFEELVGQDVTVSDVDQGSVALGGFISSIENRRAFDETNRLLVSKLTSPLLLPSLHRSLETSLSNVCQTLIKSWMSYLAATAPRRTVTATERLIRHVATQLQLAGSGISRLPTAIQPERESTQGDKMKAATLILPVRQASGHSDKDQQGHPKQVGAHPVAFEEEGFVPAATLPTPEPTPSLRSQGSRSSLSGSEDQEGTATRTLSRRGRIAMDILSQWSLGQEPEDKDWEANTATDEQDNIPRDVVSIQGKRKRKDRERMARVQNAEAEGPSWQAVPRGLMASQDNVPSYGLDSSQPTPLVMSQPQPGRHGGRRHTNYHTMLEFRTQGFNGYAVKYSPFFDSRIAVASAANFGLVGNGRLYILGLTAQGIVAEKWFDTQDSLYDLAWSESHENQCVVAAGDGSIKLFDISLDQFPVQSWQEHKREVFAVHWNLVAKDTFCSSSWDGTVKIWSPTRTDSILTLPTHSCTYSASFSPHSPSLLSSVSSDSHLRLFDLRTPSSASNHLTASIPLHTQPLSSKHQSNVPFQHIPPSEALTHDWNKYRPEFIAAAGVDRLIRVFDIRNPAQGPVAVLPGHEYAVRKVAWSPHLSDVLLSASYDMTCRLWTDGSALGVDGEQQQQQQQQSLADLQRGGDPMAFGGGRELGRMGKHTEFVMGVDWCLFGAEGWCASVGWDERLLVWDVRTVMG
ncbi:MAG: hypothetical protein Q9180_001844, partial [Flavoplaca navasiana]